MLGYTQDEDDPDGNFEPAANGKICGRVAGVGECGTYLLDSNGQGETGRYISKKFTQGATGSFESLE